jgi:hypothetical protein
MKAALAAAYVDESESKFHDGVRTGKWPKGIKDGGNTYWFIEDLDAALDHLKPNAATDDDGWGDYIGGQA